MQYVHIVQHTAKDRSAAALSPPPPSAVPEGCAQLVLYLSRVCASYSGYDMAGLTYGTALLDPIRPALPWPADRLRRRRVACKVTMQTITDKPLIAGRYVSRVPSR